MSQLLVDDIVNKDDTGSPGFSKGAVVTGIVTATSFSGSGANLTGIDATALKDSNGTVRVQANTTGAVVSGNVDVSGNMNVTGTLTYEDVTNIDSVGLITARRGVIATGIVTATSFDGSGANLTGIEAAPTVQLVASGSINADQTVILTSDGKVKAITNTTQSIGDAVTADSRTSMTLTNCAYSSTSNKVVVVSRASNTGYATVGTVSGTTITFGTSVQFATTVHDDSSSCLDISWDSDDDIYLISWRATSNDYIRAIILTGISGTVPSFSSDFEVSTTLAQYPVAAYSTAKGRWLLFYSRSSASVGSVRSISWNGSSQGVGGEYNFTGSQINKIDVCYDSNADRFVALYRYFGDSNKLTSSVIKIEANGSLSWGSTLTVMDPTTAEAPGIVYDPDTQNVIGVYTNESLGNKVYSIVGKVNTNTEKVTWNDHLSMTPTTSSVVTQNYRSPLLYDAFASKFITFYIDSSNNIHMILMMYNSAGTGLEAVTDTTIQSGGSNITGGWFGACMDTTANRGVLSYAPTNGQGAQVQVIRPPSTDVTGENMIGFSKAGYTNGQTATVKVVGNTTTQSGLTPAQKYYVQNDGSLALTAAVPNVVAGRALTATSLLIQPA